MTLLPWAAIGVAFAIALVLTGFFRRYALHAGIVDVPNGRSSHSEPTPRGGGLSILVVVLAATAVLGITAQIDGRVALSTVLAGTMVGLLGWADDRKGLSPGVRLVVQALAALLALVILRGWPRIYLWYGVSLHIGWLGYPLGVLLVLWFLNLYNFMDGIDGLAGVEAITVSFFAAAAARLAGGDAGLSWLLAVLAAAAAGFLIWNWPPARVFMGDGASGFLGLMFGLLAINTSGSGTIPLPVWLILLAVFLTDGTVTLLRRILRGERFIHPHRSHAYQRAARVFRGHSPVTIAALVINSLLGLVVLAAIHWDQPVIIVIAAVAPLLAYLVIERFEPM